MKAFIRGAGVVGGFGCGLTSLAEAIGKQRDPDPGSPVPGPNAETAATSALTARTDLLDRFVPARTLRRVDHYSRMAILASHLAFEDAGMEDGLPDDTGLVVATGMGPTANTLDLHPVDAAAADLALSPIVFSNSVHNAAAAYISMLLKIRGPSLSINQYEMSVPLAFQTAIDWLDEGRTGTVMVGSVDCFSKALQETALSCRNSKNSGSGQIAAPVGEGSAFFVLTRPGVADVRRPFIYEVHMGGATLPDGVPLPNTLVLYNGNGENPDLGGQSPSHANFAHLYGTFPTSMAMDVAAAMLLLRTEPPLCMSLLQFAAGRALPENPQIGCLKKGETGDWGMIVVGR